MKNEITKIGESKEQLDALNNIYKVIEFEKIKPEYRDKPIMSLFIPINATVIRRFACYKKNTLGVPDTGFSESIGTKFIGDIVQRKVYPYSFSNSKLKVVTTDLYSVIVFGDSESQLFPHLINKAFEESGHPLLEKEKVIFIVAK